jgi:hypothetical protein
VSSAKVVPFVPRWQRVPLRTGDTDPVAPLEVELERTADIIERAIGGLSIHERIAVEHALDDLVERVTEEQT